MSHSQTGVVAENRHFAVFLVMQVNSQDRGSEIARFCASVPELALKIQGADTSALLTCSVGFGAQFWDSISPNARPAQLRPLRAIGAGARKAPGTGGDLFFHICSERSDLNFECAKNIVNALGGKVRVLEEVSAFAYRDSRDLTGFIDGTQNPKGDERAEAALIGSEDPGFAGGSYALTQRYVHNLKSWATLSDAEQEKVIGRTKADSEELPPELKPENSHISRAELREGEVEYKIVRQSLPYGTASGESGLYFVAYAKDPTIFERQLARMMGSTGDGVHDRLMEFSEAVSGAFFFIPSLNTLRSLL
ncbi:MAG: Dyp-type peroxidase [Oligoflexia bacterium]|nr:Dyp-type peroxidase [Oligoflexia bacterium]